MLFIPVPMVIALMLLLMLALFRERLVSTDTGRAFAGLLLLYCLGLTLIGLRWGYGVTLLLPLQALVAMVWSAWVWLAFRSLVHSEPVWQRQRDWPHLLPSAAVVLSIVLQPDLIAWVIIGTYLVYGVALLRLAQPGPDRLNQVRLIDAERCHRALQITGWLFFAFAVVDLLILADYHWQGGRWAAGIVAWANVVSLGLLGAAGLVAGQSQSVVEEVPQKTTSPDSVAPEVVIDSEEAQQTLLRVEQVLTEQKLYCEPELNLQRLARKVGIPARQVSRAVNQLTDGNVSQWVNQHRIRAACDLLQKREQNITQVMLAVGFGTKSNFNREFKRLTGVSPSVWRQQNTSANGE